MCLSVIDDNAFYIILLNLSIIVNTEIFYLVYDSFPNRFPDSGFIKDEYCKTGTIWRLLVSFFLKKKFYIILNTAFQTVFVYFKYRQ